jgi:glycosyltransferase involved in cell wall biosynthesis
MSGESLSIVIPAKNEATSLARLLPELKARFPTADTVVVDDGSTDATREVGEREGARVVSHPYCLGNGAAIKTGARQAMGERIVFMDADGQHAVDDIQRLLEKFSDGYDMVVGARSACSQASLWRRLANGFYNRLASRMVGQRIEDLTSGFRVTDAEKFREFLTMLPNGFSYPTTSTMAFFRSGYSVAYVPIHANRREGKSHIRPLRDGIRFFLIIFRVATLYSPLKIFAPISAGFFLVGLLHYAYAYLARNQFSNMTALLFTTSVLVFLMGLISEQITTLTYSQHRE